MTHEIERITLRINVLRKQDHIRRVASAVQIGGHLIRAQSILKPAEWTPWRNLRVHLSERTASNLIALARFHSSQPAVFRQLARLGLNKLYRIAELPRHFLRRLRPETPLRVPGTRTMKTIEEMNPVELNRCARQWSSRHPHRRPHHTAHATVRAARKLQGLVGRLIPDLRVVRHTLRAAVSAGLSAVRGACDVCLRRIKRAQGVA